MLKHIKYIWLNVSWAIVFFQVFVLFLKLCVFVFLFKAWRIGTNSDCMNKTWNKIRKDIGISFMWESLHLDLYLVCILLNPKLKLLLTLVTYLHVKRKKKSLLCIMYFSHYEYAGVIAEFYNGFNNRIVNVIWNRVTHKHMLPF